MTDILIQELLDKVEARMAEAQKRLYEIHDKKIPQELTPWLRRTGWVQRFDNMDMKVLHDLLEPPKPKLESQNPGDKLHLVWDSVVRVIEKCWMGVRDVENRNWRLILYWLNSAEKDAQSQSPFKIHMEKKTRAAYGVYWQKFMIFVLRGLDHPEHGIEYTAAQRDVLTELMTELWKEEPLEKQIDKLVLQASVLFIQHDDFDKERSALLYYIGLIGYHIGWGRWRGPGEYTNILAALQWVIRIFILESAVPFEERDDWRTLHRDNPLVHFKLSHVYLSI